MKAATTRNPLVETISFLAEEIEGRVSQIIKERPEVTVRMQQERNQQKILARLRTYDGNVFIAQDRGTKPEKSVNNITYKLLRQLKKKRGSRLSKRRHGREAIFNEEQAEQRTECA